MIHLALPPMAVRRLPFYLAMEEWAARTLPEGDYFFSWRVLPTVICGRNQNINKEVDTGYCKREGIDVVRRRSGGGAVYADMDNFMFSYISPGDEIDSTFSRYTTMIADMLGALGLDAKATGRNDLLINGYKVAGNAFYHIPGRCIVHGTMLYDYDTSRLQRALTPSCAKLESKGVQSTPQRITSLKAEGLTLSPDEFEDFAINHFCGNKEIRLSESDIAEIEKIEAGYYNEDFLYRHKDEKNRTADIRRSVYIDGAGEFEVAINLKTDTTISELGIWGDFFVVGDIQSDILRPLEGVIYDRAALRKAIDSIDPSAVINKLSRNDLLNLLI